MENSMVNVNGKMFDAKKASSDELSKAGKDNYKNYVDGKIDANKYEHNASVIGNVAKSRNYEGMNGFPK